MLNPADHTATSELATGVSRRLVVKGAAWSVPAIAVASAVPAHAASTDQNLAVAANDCSLVTLRIGSDAMPGFTYTVTEGTVPTGTQITISSGGAVAINSGNFTLPTGVSLLSVGGNVATFELQQDYTLGQSFTIGLKGLTINAIGTYTTDIITPDAVQNDDIAIMTAGGVGLGGVIGAFICFTPGTAGAPTIPDLALNIDVAVTNCPAIALLGNRPQFTISVDGGDTIPAGTPFVFYSTAALSAGLLGAWTFDSGTALSLDALGIGSDAAVFTTSRDITSGTPMVIRFEGLASLDVNNTFYLAYLGNDADPSDNAGGMIVTGSGLGPLFLGTCQKATT